MVCHAVYRRYGNRADVFWCSRTRHALCFSTYRKWGNHSVSSNRHACDLLSLGVTCLGDLYGGWIITGLFCLSTQSATQNSFIFISNHWKKDLWSFRGCGGYLCNNWYCFWCCNHIGFWCHSNQCRAELPVWH